MTPSSIVKAYTLVSGRSMPGFGLGTWQSEPGIVGQAVKDAIALGYRHIDCAAIYGNEPEIGAAFSSVFTDTDVNREDLFITSKLWNSKHHPADVEPALQQTLSDLGLSYLDLYLIHWPVVLTDDGSYLPLEDVPISDTWKVMEECVDKGLVRDIGVSNFSVQKLKSLLETARIKPSVNQVERHPYLQNQELIDYCKKEGIRLTAYSPLGTSATKFANQEAKPILKDASINEIATKHGATPAQVLIQWALECDTVVIPKSTKLHRLKENLEAVTKFKLDADDVAKIKAIDEHTRYLDGEMWCGEGSPYTLENLWNEEHIIKTATDEL